MVDRRRGDPAGRDPGFRWVRDLGRRRALLLGLAAALITVNWGGYIYGVNSGHVVETSLGLLHQPARDGRAGRHASSGRSCGAPQWVAVGIAAVAVVVLTVAYGRPPWIALTLAFSFGFYGLVKKQVGVGGTQSLAVETDVPVPARAGLRALILQATGKGTLTTEGAGHVAAARRRRHRHRDPADALRRRRGADPADDDRPAPVPRADHAVRDRRRDPREDMPASRWAGFTLVWIAVVVFTWDSLRARRLVAVTVRA